ncbi:MAG: TetM/TetW/TetO/TetS family tetracycline resistance ribosomal protection protein [Clostridia bacterium]|nr:TetM/TetW/TetO/TetS family tetracycline resistance ribosomal protection protein [Clostridia bacterium]
MKQIVTGILAHVDSGKTTLSEAMLYKSGTIRSHGRVDHGNAFLDTNEIEREKGITIFSKQAIMTFSDTSLTLLDTPGHIDFSTETERTLGVLDYCILVISGTDGVQSHTQTLWKLLERYNVPTFIFVNKMDISHIEKSEIIADIRKYLSENCVELSDTDSLVLCDESIMDEYLNTDSVSDISITNAIANRTVFPCFFGAALKMDGVEEFLSALDRYTKMPTAVSEFGAKVYKISHDADGKRLTHIKITGGTLKSKSQLEIRNDDGTNETEKVDTLRIYSGEKYTMTDCATQGMVCAVTGLTKTVAGMGLGFECNTEKPVLEPVLTYKLEILDNTDVHTALTKLRILEQEDPQLRIIWNEILREIHLQLMGEVQIEVLRRIISERFDMKTDFSEGAISYRETIADTVEGVGHFEPLRHYSEVHLILEPGKRGSGVVIKSDCSEDLLDKNWQRLILTHIAEKTHTGVLTNSPITDIKITLVSGKAHKKHTEGGDFRQATYRAIRQGLMQAESVLLEPYYSFRLEIPTESVGRAMTDLQQMCAEFSAPELKDEMSIIKGTAPVSTMRGYASEITAYTSGKGKLLTTLKGYEPCHNSDEVIADAGYNPDSDTLNPSGSVFCAHGAGFNVPWNEVEDYMHLESVLKSDREEAHNNTRVSEYVNTVINDEELLRIFEKTYGPVKVKSYTAMQKRKSPAPKPAKYAKPRHIYDGPVYVLVDGYNIIFAWDELKEIAKESLDAAREILVNRLCNYKGFTECNLILVFDAYKVKGGVGSVEHINGIDVVYTKEAETADAYIEKVTHELTKKHRVRVATSDGLEQLIILGSGAQRVPASEFLKEVTETENKIREFIRNM